MELTELEKKKLLEGIDYSLLQRILEGEDYTKYDNMHEIIKSIYEKVVMYYSLKYYNAKSEMEYVQTRVIEKNTVIDKLNEQLTFLKERADEPTLQDFGTKFLSKQDQTLA